MQNTLLVFGGSGFIGEHIARAAWRKGWRTCIADKNENAEHGSIEWISADIIREDETADVIMQAKPDLVVNVAAKSNIDFVQQNRQRAYDANVRGAVNIAKGCARASHKIRYVFFSSDAVYNGRADVYYEDDKPDPVNYYGETKEIAEKAIVEIDPTAIIVRISLVLGFQLTRGNSFLNSLHKTLQENRAIACPIDEYRTPIDIYTLSECVLELGQTDFSGIIHIGSTNSLNRYELAKAAAKKMGFEESLIIEVPETKDYPGRAPRHKNGILCVEKAKRILKIRLPTAHESIERAIQNQI